MTALLVIVILVLLIVVHELGHFLAAKIFGVRVDEFGVGYPPRAFLFGKIGETEYTLNWIPFGGFVRLFGEEEGTQHGRGSFMDSPRWKQAIILVAGVFMNAVAAWALFSGALVLGVPRVVDTPQPNEAVHMIISDVVAGSPAEAAGIVPGDEVVALSDAKGNTPAALTPDAFVAFVGARGGQLLSLSYIHNGATTTSSVTPAHAVVAQSAGRPAIGVGLVLVANQSIPWNQAMIEALTTTKDAFEVVGSGLWVILKSAAHGSPDLSDVVGPVGLVSAVGEAAQNGLGEVLSLAAFISVNLTIINLIPIPALDGGRFLVLIVEAITRRSAPRIAVQVLNVVGVALIIALMLTVTYHDLARLIG